MADAKVTVRGGAGNAVQIQGRDVPDIAPTNGQALAWDAGDSAWEPQTISGGGSSEWTDTGTVLHPSEETVDNVVVGGTTTANSDIVLGVDGAAVFNEQGAAVDFRVEGDTDTHCLFVDGSADKIGVGGVPASKFQITDTTGSASGKYKFDGNVSSGYDMSFSLDGTGAKIGHNSAGRDIQFQTGSTTRATIRGTGNVGINLTGTDINEKLTVDGVVSLKTVSAPSATADYAKLYAKDAVDDNTMLLLHMDSGFTDSSNNNYSPTITGATIDTSLKKVGTGSGAFDGAGDLVDYPYQAGYFNGSDFTIECWTYMISGGDTYQDLINAQGTSGNTGWAIGRYDSSGASDPRIYGSVSSGSWSAITSGTLNFNTWYHVALVRHQGTNTLYIDGSAIGSTTDNLTEVMTACRLGTASAAAGGAAREWKGNVDELRISNVARYTANFTAPTTAFGASAELYAMDEAGNQTQISPHNEKGEWEYYSRNIKTGRSVRINMEEVVRDLGGLTGKNYIKEQTIPIQPDPDPEPEPEGEVPANPVEEGP
jgi:hypothetical protein